MEHHIVVSVWYEEHVGCKSAKSVTYPDAIFVASSSEELVNLLLRRAFRLKSVKVIVFTDEEFLPDIVSMNAEDAVYYRVVDDGVSLAVAME